MQWRDQGIILSVRKHGEGAVILSLFTREHGRHLGLVRGGNSKKNRAAYQVGNLLDVTWNARLEDHLGAYVCELSRAVAAPYFSDPQRLACLTSFCSLLDVALPEREAHGVLFEKTLAFLAARLAQEDFVSFYIRWELDLLKELGFGLDLSTCVVTGACDDLIYVSPKSGKAVCGEAGAPYREKLLTLPSFLLGESSGVGEDFHHGFLLTGYFLKKHLFHHKEGAVPFARGRFVAAVS